MNGQRSNLWLLVPCAGAEGIAKEAAQVWEAAQNEMLLDEEASPAAVTDELQHLLALLKAHEDELARINKYQHLFKVCAGVLACSAAVRYPGKICHGWASCR
jgi:hypothetical protein